MRYLIALLFAFACIAFSVEESEARPACSGGKIWRPSLKRCGTIGEAQAQGVRVKARFARQAARGKSVRYSRTSRTEARRARVAARAQARAERRQRLAQVRVSRATVSAYPSPVARAAAERGRRFGVPPVEVDAPVRAPAPAPMQKGVQPDPAFGSLVPLNTDDLREQLQNWVDQQFIEGRI